MNIYNLISDLDKKISAEVEIDDKNNIQLTMLLIECKYNLDIIASIDFGKSNSDDTQLREVIKLLSSAALEKLLINGSFKSNSVFMKWLYKSYNQISFLIFESSEDQEQISPNDTLLFNMYKRITVLKALATINPPYTSLKQLNFKKRMINLNEVLLEINSKIHILWEYSAVKKKADSWMQSAHQIKKTRILIR